MVVVVVFLLFSPAESRQASGQWSRVFPQVYHCHWCTAARKVQDTVHFKPDHFVVSGHTIYFSLTIYYDSTMIKSKDWAFIYIYTNFAEMLTDHLSPTFRSTCLRLGSVLWTACVPFLVCKTYGLIGYMRLVVEEHTGLWPPAFLLTDC